MLKRSFLTALLIITISTFTNLYAQKIEIGLKAGTNIANVTTDPALPSEVTKKARVGMIFGALAEFHIAQSFYVQPEVEYINKGLKMDGTYTGGSFTSVSRIDYLQIPVYAKFKFVNKKSPFMPFVFAGPVLGFNLKSEAEVTETTLGSGGVSTTTTTTTDNKTNTESIEFGLNFGAGAEFRVAPKVGIFISGLYNLGLTNINKSSTDTTKIKNNGINIFAGVKFGI